jgi:hypothetical protein
MISKSTIFNFVAFGCMAVILPVCSSNNSKNSCTQNGDCDSTKKCQESVCVARTNCPTGTCEGNAPCIKGICMDCKTKDDCSNVKMTCNSQNVCVYQKCENNVCGTNQDCDDSSGTVVCVCSTGYKGDNCDQCAVGYHEQDATCVIDTTCQATSCSGHGVCSATGNVVSCSCIKPEYAGDHCELCADGYTAYPVGSDTCVSSNYCVDKDGDHYGDGPGCLGPDCVDDNPDINPGMSEVCNGIDDNCDGRTDCGDTGICEAADPCFDNNPCTQDICLPPNSPATCTNYAWPNPDQVSCDPDGAGTAFTDSDGVCTANKKCVKLRCRLCNEKKECQDNLCICTGDNCSKHRCFNQTPTTCQYLTDLDTGCGLGVNVGASCGINKDGNNCVGSCSANGTCSTANTKCVGGTCCKCDSSGTPTYDNTQNSDCSGYNANNACSNRCFNRNTCAMPNNSTACGGCGYDGNNTYICICENGTCDGKGGCSTDNNNCSCNSIYKGTCSKGCCNTGYPMYSCWAQYSVINGGDCP